MRARKERLESLLSYVRIFPQRRRELVPRFALEWGLTKEKVREYVDLLLVVGRLEEVKEGGPTAPGQLPRMILQVVGPGPGRLGRKSPLKGKSC